MHRNHQPSLGSVREAIKRLRAKGFKIKSIHGKGYRLITKVCTNCRVAPAIRAIRNIKTPKLPMCVVCSRAYCAGYAVASKRLVRRGQRAVQVVSVDQQALCHSQARGHQAAVPEPPVGPALISLTSICRLY